VISGDTHPTQATIDVCRGCEVLIHEVLSPTGCRGVRLHAYAAVHHTTTSRLVELAQQAKPALQGDVG
jgi:ribonuclease BN (tRNA processing enzyme)